MEDLIIGTMFIVTVICYTVYKIDCNHVKNPKNNDYPTGGLRKQAEHKPESNRPSEETMKKLFGKDYKSEIGRLSAKSEKAPIPPRKDSE